MRNTFLLVALMPSCMAGMAQPVYRERWRPQFHFSPKAHWMNDPNGMVFYRGIYHLFFQYYPDSSVWGPMHWGHAESKDLMHWEEEPVALYPDKLGYIFSGSTVVDNKNTSRFGQPDDVPLVAIFTQHDPVGASQHRNDFQNQSLAYSLDNGQHWLKYDQNPVLRNPGIADFRDPKVFWYQPGHQWIMVLAVKDRVAFYASPDLKSWSKAGEFGKDAGAHGGVWECPDLFPLNDGHGHMIWVLIVNINPGGPNGGSATQYFLGQFDGKTFTPSTAGTRWLDYGPDEYAGVTWANTGARRIFLGWMSNWLYAQQVPTDPWRSANTLPRQLELAKAGDSLYVTSMPVREVDALVDRPTRPSLPAALPWLSKIQVRSNKAGTFNLLLTNDSGERVTIGYDAATQEYFIDRKHAGISVGPDFEKIYRAPRISQAPIIDWTIYVDASSIELFADGGLTVMTALVFPTMPYTRVDIKSIYEIVPNSFSISTMKRIHN